jgi:hypothetical protein
LEEEINVQDINWEDSPEGTTHYDPKGSAANYKRYVEETGKWENAGWLLSRNSKEREASYIERPVEAPYTTPEADPFSEALKQKQSGEAILALYLAAVNSKVAQDETEVITREHLNELFSDERTKWVSVNGDIKSCVTGEGTVMMSPVGLGLCNELFLEQIGAVQSKSTRASWYDYDREELIGFPEKGEKVYDAFAGQDVEYLGKFHNSSTVALENEKGSCYKRLTKNIRPLDYKEIPTYVECKEQHKQLEQLVRLIDEQLGWDDKEDAIELYNRGWRVSKEEIV